MIELIGMITILNLISAEGLVGSAVVLNISGSQPGIIHRESGLFVLRVDSAESGELLHIAVLVVGPRLQIGGLSRDQSAGGYRVSGEWRLLVRRHLWVLVQCTGDGRIRDLVLEVEVDPR